MRNSLSALSPSEFQGFTQSVSPYQGLFNSSAPLTLQQPLQRQSAAIALPHTCSEEEGAEYV